MTAVYCDRKQVAAFLQLSFLTQSHLLCNAGEHCILLTTLLTCRVYSERQQLNQQILGQLTGTAAMEPVECLMQKQEYITPHSRANIVHAEKHQQPSQKPIACPAPIKTEEHMINMGVDSTHDPLPVLLAQLEQNLAKELRHISEQDYVTLTKLLKPVQVWTVFVDIHVLCLQQL